MQEPRDIFEIIVETGEPGLDAVAGLIGGRDFTVELPPQRGKGVVAVKMQLETRHAAETLLKKLRALAPRGGFEARLISVPGREWAEAWKENFKPLRVSNRLLVMPPWEHAPACGRRVKIVKIEPGLCFGTGLHATTRLCLKFLDELNASGKTASFLDLGCGSGILAIAAAKLGYKRILAVDNDPDAARITAANARRNRGGARIETRIADAARMALGETFEVVAANILAQPLIGNAGRIARLVAKPDGVLVVSGILSSESDRVCRAYEANGLVPAQKAELDGWSAVCFAPQRVDAQRK